MQSFYVILSVDVPVAAVVTLHHRLDNVPATNGCCAHASSELAFAELELKVPHIGKILGMYSV
jgi:hypothetical protein